MNLINFQLVTPEKTLLQKELLSLSCPTELGQITVLPGHVPLVANLVSGELIAKSATEEEYIHVSGGFIQVNPNSQVVVLADAAEHYYEIDAQRAAAAKSRAEDALKQKHASEEEYAKVAASLEKSLSRLNIVRKRAHKRGTPITGEGIFKE